MITLLTIIVICLSGLLVYKKRFTSTFTIGGLYFTQLYYLIFGPLVVSLFINLALNISKRPLIQNLPVTDGFVFSCFVLSTVIAAMGLAIHSTSTSVMQAFLKDRKLSDADKKKIESTAFWTNEKFHGSLSHNMFYVGGLSATFFLAILEINHPGQPPATFLMNNNFLIIIGILIGVTEGLAVLWSTYIGFSLIVSILGVSFMYFFDNPAAINSQTFPIAFVMYVSLITLLIMLVTTLIIFRISEVWSKRFVKLLYPKGHSIHHKMDIRVLAMNFKRDWGKNQK